MMNKTMTHCMLAALFAAGVVACGSENDNDLPGNGNGGGSDTVDLGQPDTGPAGPEDMGPPDMGEVDERDCRIDQRDCDAGEVCNLITGDCEAGTSCTRDDDCNPCDESDPDSTDDDCGHGLHVSAYCDEDHGSVCTRIRTVCEPCQTDADCGVFSEDVFPLPSVCIEDPESDDGRRVCATRADFGCPRGYESRDIDGLDNNYCINPLGCPNPEEQFFCAGNDPDMDGVAEENEECADPTRPNPQVGQETVCQDDPCPGTGNLRCAVGAFLAGLPPTCGDYCLSDSECEQRDSSRPFCAPSGVCSTGCEPGECADGVEVCHVDGTCQSPCGGPGVSVSEADADCVDRFGTADNGDRVYCNVTNRTPPPEGQPNPTPVKDYRDINACAPLGCEVQPGEQANPDCDTNQACDESLLIPECVEGCFTEIDCAGVSGQSSVCVNATRQDITDPGGDALVSQALCRQQERFPRESDNRTTIGQCCNPGCLADGDCFSNEFCCGEQVSREDGDPKPGSSFADPSMCRNLTPLSNVQAQSGQCFEAPLQPWCETQCDPMDPFNTCNATMVGNLVMDPQLPYNPATVWPQGRNTLQEDRDNINNGQPFTELQTCTTVADGMNPMQAVTTICTVSFDRNSPDTNAPRGWQCSANLVPCLQDSDCGGQGSGLVCIGEDTTVNPPAQGACKCGEDDAVTVACPQQVGDFDFGGRNRCVKVGPDNYLTNTPTNNASGERFEDDEFACVFSFTCSPPGAFFPEESENEPATFGAACQANFGGP